MTVDAAALCLKAGNAVILRGGQGGVSAPTPPSWPSCGTRWRPPACPGTAWPWWQDTSRSSASELMNLTEYLDVLIPRGGGGTHPLGHRQRPGAGDPAPARGCATSMWTKRLIWTWRCASCATPSAPARRCATPPSACWWTGPLPPPSCPWPRQLAEASMCSCGAARRPGPSWPGAVPATRRGLGHGSMGTTSWR